MAKKKQDKWIFSDGTFNIIRSVGEVSAEFKIKEDEDRYYYSVAIWYSIRLGKFIKAEILKKVNAEEYQLDSSDTTFLKELSDLAKEKLRKVDSTCNLLIRHASLLGRKKKQRSIKNELLKSVIRR